MVLTTLTGGVCLPEAGLAQEITLLNCIPTEFWLRPGNSVFINQAALFVPNLYPIYFCTVGTVLAVSLKTVPAVACYARLCTKNA